MHKYNWGILGTGVIANQFAQDLKLLPAATMHSVHSRTYEKAQQFADEFGFTKNYYELDSFLEDPQLDIVYIATPNHLHYLHAMACLKAGKHILVEKPLALSVDQAKEMANLSKKKGLFCMEAMWSRFIPAYQKVKTLLEKDEIGAIKMITAEFGQFIKYHPDQFRFSEDSGGGCLMDLGIYPISLILMLMGKPDKIHGVCYKDNSKIDVHNRIIFKYKNGSIADIGSSFDCRLSNKIWIGGQNGAIDVSAPIYRPDSYNIYRYSDAQNISQNASVIRNKIHNSPLLSKIIKKINTGISLIFNRAGSKKQVAFQGNGYYHEAAEVMNCIKNGKMQSMTMSLNDSIAVLEITEMLRKKWNIHIPKID